jgi:hypothetical protein
MRKIKITHTTRNTKPLRLEIYKAMLAFIKEEEKSNYGCYNAGFCLAIAEVTNIFSGSNSKFNFFDSTFKKTAYKELEAYKPEDYFAYWFPRTPEGTNKRIKILETIIKEMSSK